MTICELERIFYNKFPEKFLNENCYGARINEIQLKKYKNIYSNTFLNDYYLLGSKYNIINDIGNMFKYFELALELNQDNYMVYMSLGTACFKKRLYNESIKCFEKAIELGAKKERKEYEEEIFYRMELTYEAMGDVSIFNKYRLKYKDIN